MAKNVKPSKKFFYVYKIVDKRNGMYYIGSRGSSKKPLDDLGKRYFTSSLYLSNDFKDNPDNFSLEILKECKNRVEAFDYERELQIQLECHRDPNSYNKVISGVMMMPSRKGSVVDEDMRKHLSMVLKKQMSEMTPEERSLKFGNFGANNPFNGKKHPKELQEKLRDKIKKYSREMLKEEPEYFRKKALLAHTPEARMKRFNTTSINLEVVFTNGQTINFKKIYQLSEYLGGCRSIAYKILHNPHLRPKYNIQSMELKNEN